MSGTRSRELVEHARELERQDADVAARIDLVVGVLQRVDGLRADAGRVRASLEAIPDEIAHAEHAEAEARIRGEAARRELAEAEQRLDEIGRSRRASDETKVAAERAVRRGVVAATDAATTVARMEEHSRSLRGDQATLGAEADGLAVYAEELARDVSDVPRLSDSGRVAPGRSLVEIEEWGARAHAALFVVRGGLESERERLVYEANGLAAAALGEQVGGTSVTLVRRRLEESLAP